MKTIDEVLKSKNNGLYYGNRIILPFKGTLLKVVMEDDIITDFSTSSKLIHIHEGDDYLDIYFKDYEHLKDDSS